MSKICRSDLFGWSIDIMSMLRMYKGPKGMILTSWRALCAFRPRVVHLNSFQPLADGRFWRRIFQVSFFRSAGVRVRQPRHSSVLAKLGDKLKTRCSGASRKLAVVKESGSEAVASAAFVTSEPCYWLVKVNRAGFTTAVHIRTVW